MNKENPKKLCLIVYSVDVDIVLNKTYMSYLKTTMIIDATPCNGKLLFSEINGKLQTLYLEVVQYMLPLSLQEYSFFSFS